MRMGLALVATRTAPARGDARAGHAALGADPLRHDRDADFRRCDRGAVVAGQGGPGAREVRGRRGTLGARDRVARARRPRRAAPRIRRERSGRCARRAAHAQRPRGRRSRLRDGARVVAAARGELGRLVLPLGVTIVVAAPRSSGLGARPALVAAARFRARSAPRARAGAVRPQREPRRHGARACRASLRSGLGTSLVAHRLLPSRTFLQPVLQLEGLRGARAARAARCWRARTRVRPRRSPSGREPERALISGLVLLVVLLTPAEIDWDVIAFVIGRRGGARPRARALPGGHQRLRAAARGRRLRALHQPPRLPRGLGDRARVPQARRAQRPSSGAGAAAAAAAVLALLFAPATRQRTSACQRTADLGARVHRRGARASRLRRRAEGDALAAEAARRATSDAARARLAAADPRVLRARRRGAAVGRARARAGRAAVLAARRALAARARARAGSAAHVHGARPRPALAAGRRRR